MAPQDQTAEGVSLADTNMTETIIDLQNGITIRRYRQSDVRSVAHHANNKNVWHNLRNRMPNPYTLEDGQWWVNHISDPSNHVRSGAWTLETGSQGPAIPTKYAICVNDEASGTIGIDFGAPDDVYARTAEIGYWLGEEHWGKGVMSAVVPAFVAWTMDTFGILVRLNANLYERSAASRRCLEKARFEYEGIRKCAYMKKGIVGNEVMMGFVRADLEA